VYRNGGTSVSTPPDPAAAGLPIAAVGDSVTWTG